MKKINVDVAIIGGGASGLMCGCVLGKRCPDKKIVIIEKADRVGKKILVSGNGRCNLTNTGADVSNYRTSFDDGVKFLLKNYPPSRVIEYFESIGLVCMTDNDGRVYPLSRQSSAVLSVLRNELKRNNVSEMCNTEVLSVNKANSGYCIKCNDVQVIAQKVVIATGGKNNHAQKVVGDSYAPAKSIGHKVTALSPSLCPIKVKSDLLKSLKGIRASAKVTAIVNGQAIKSEFGEVQFTADALSGICVFNLSHIANNQKSVIIRVQLLNNFSCKEIYNMICKRIDLVKKDNVQEIFTGLFHKNIGLALLKTSGIDTSKSADKMSEAEIKRLADTIDKWDFEVTENNDFSNAQVTSGGINGCEIDPQTLQSKVADGVYLCGEAIDVDGDCGGYNLQFAFASGMCVGENI